MNTKTKAGQLYIVSTPIGNLEDITLRAIRILKEVDLIAAEDTRHSKKLLQYYGINTPLISLHEHNEQDRVEQLINRLKQGQQIALISDAGTPLISDPGYVVVQAIRAENFQITPIPGACAAIAALTISGLPTDQFTFEGFLPAKSANRQKCLQALMNIEKTLIFYESPHRLLDTLADMQTILGDQREVVLIKELTKAFESYFRGSLPQVINWLSENPERQRGEFVILVKGYKCEQHQDQKILDTGILLDTLLAELPLKQAVTIAAKLTGERKNTLYDLALTKSKSRVDKGA